MNEREQFEAWIDTTNFKSDSTTFHNDLFIAWQACAESKQSELDKANARIAQMEEALKAYMQAGVCQSTDFQLQMKATKLAMDAWNNQSSWLL
jgi:hypothetical protein